MLTEIINSSIFGDILKYQTGKKFISLLILIALSGTFLAPESKAANKAGKGTGNSNSAKRPASQDKMLSIKSSSDNGSLNINLSKLGIYMRGKLGVSLWRADKPTRAILINPENKTFLFIPVNEYIRDIRDEFFPWIVAKKYNSKKVKLPTGFDAVEYTIVDPAINNPGHIMAKVVGLNKNLLPDATHRMWCRYTGITGADFGIPVAIYREREFHGKRHIRRQHSRPMLGHKLRSYLVPVELKRKPLDPNLFGVPKNYKQARDKAALYLSTDGEMKKSDLEDFFRVPMK